MMRAFYGLMMFAIVAACTPSPSPASSASASPTTTSAKAADRRCLPVVAKTCGCVYACGVGERKGDRYVVRHAFWKDAELSAVVEPWCVDGACTDVFAAEIDCDGICNPKPADASCHFGAGGACVGASK